MSESDSPLDVARALARVYGHAYAPPFTYPAGVALSGRLRVAELDGDLDRVAAEIRGLVAPWLDPDEAYDARFGTAALATACWGDELYATTGDARYREHLCAVADRFDAAAGTPVAPPLDPDIRVEDFFFAGTLLGRAYAVSGAARHAATLVRYLEHVDTQQADGLYWHCHASPYYWGRGNAFAALGFAEALTYLPEADRSALLEAHVRHCRALAAHQHPSGMWHQLIDDPTTYLEHSATSMIGCSIARGVRLGWLDAAEFRPVAEGAWAGVAARTSAAGELEHVCVGTGPLPSREAYVDRACTDTTDARGGAMALWFAAEMARLERA